jgi:hypothetical protein
VPLFSTAVPETALTLVSVSVSPLRPGVIRRNVEINRLAGYPRCGRTRSGPGGSFALASTTVPLLTQEAVLLEGACIPGNYFCDKWKVSCECEQALARQPTPKSQALSFCRSTRPVQSITETDSALEEYVFEPSVPRGDGSPLLDRKTPPV